MKTTIKSDLEPTRWAWLRLEAEKRADELKDNISKGLEINKEIEAIPRDGDIAVILSGARCLTRKRTILIRSFEEFDPISYP